MSKRKILAASWHPGGINAIVPVIKQLITDGKVDVIVVGHEFSEPILAHEGIPFKTIKDSGLSDVSPKSMNILLQAISPDLVLMGTAQQEGKANDILEHSLICASRSLNIRSLAVLDAWNFLWQRFSDERTRGTGERLGLLPDRIAILDQFAKEDMLREGFPEEKIVITGNPYFDILPAKARSFTKLQQSAFRERIGISCETLFFFAGSFCSDRGLERGYWDLDIVKLILGIMEELSSIGLAVRLHPRIPAQDKNQIHELIAKNTRARMVDDIDSHTLVLVAELTLCGFSAIGTEAVYLRRPVISLQPGLRREDDLLVSKKSIIPVGYDYGTCRELLKKAAEPQYRADILNFSASFATDGKATERVVSLVYSMLLCWGSK